MRSIETDKYQYNDLLIKIFIGVLGGFVWLRNWLLKYPEKYIIVTSLMIIILSLYLVIRYRKKWELLILYFFLLYYNYSIVVPYFIFPIDSFFTAYRSQTVAYYGANMLLLYMLILCFFAPKSISRNFDVNIYISPVKSNNVVVYVVCVILLFIFIFAFTRPEENQRGGSSPLYEYSIIFFIVGYMYSASKRANHLLTFALIMFALQNFFFGGRITGVQLIVIWFMMNYEHKTNLKKLIPAMLVLVLMLEFISVTRGNYSNIKNLLNSFSNRLFEEKFANDTAYSAFHTSITFLKTEFLGWSTRFRIFKNFLISMVLGGSAVEESNLSVFTRQYFVHYYGGVLPIYFHFFLGNAGVVISGLITNFYVRIIAKTSESSSDLSKCITVYMVSSVSRWYLYSPSNMLRGVMILIVVFYALKVGNALLEKRKI